MWWELESIPIVFSRDLDLIEGSLVYCGRQNPRLSASAGGGRLPARFIRVN